ncbi:stage II sporulation protein M [Methanobacterium sp.]|uniref:stage II sporulation protein M n=1 Tax=Methanobacterium sp. TaxID=2164 RepID=UPI003C7075C7
MSRLSFDNQSLSKYNIFKGVFKRNRNLLALSTIIFFMSLFIGVIVGYFSPDIIGYYLTGFSNDLSSQVDISTVSIFTHNIRAGFMAYAGGIIGIVTAALLSINGFILGAFLGYFMHGGAINHSTVNPLVFMSYVVPHGIFEIPALIMASAAGFRLTTVVIDLINSLRGKPYVNNDYRKFKDSIALLAIAVVLFAVAAVIEANFTMSIGNYITGLNLHK